MKTWITDANGNRASVEYWGSEQAARASLETLKGCSDCVDCSDCSDCSDCVSCTGCTDCSDCVSCVSCSDCMDCVSCSDCVSCTGCSDCVSCVSCSDCWSCVGCARCVGCTRCSDCTGCDLSQPHHRLPVSDPRGYTWLAVWETDAWRIRAGCRNFSIAAARTHWLSPNYNGPDSVRETVGWALDWISRKSPGA